MHRFAGRSLALLLASAAIRAPAEPPGLAHPADWPKAASPANFTTPATERRITALMARMSVAEKVGQLIQADTGSIKPDDLRRYPLGSILSGGDSPPVGHPDRSPAPAWAETADAFRQVSMEARPGHVPIPTIYGVDVIHGNSNVVGATLFPHNIGLGSMHDTVLVERIGAATAQETAAAGIDWAFGPTIATVRDVRWGRSYESYSESPAETAIFADAMVRGLQGDPVRWPALPAGHVAASAKHFLGDGGTGGQDQGNNAASERDLIRIAAPAYVAAVKAGAMTVMASYSSWQGAKMHGNASLLTGVLKDRFGFQGFIVSDWNGHGQVPGCTNDHCATAINAGIDMLMTANDWKALYTNTLQDVRDGTISQARLDDAVRRILRVKMRLGLFAPSLPWSGRYQQLGSAEHRAIARAAVRESLVLLKDDMRILPLKGTAHVLIAGDGADSIPKQSGGWSLSWQGTGNRNSDFPNGQSIGAGIAETLKAEGGSAEIRADGHFNSKPDVAIVVFGENPYAEFQGDIATVEFQPGEHADLALLKRLKAQGIPVVSVFLSGRPLWVNPEINASDAFVAAFLPGTEGGGVADVLIGDTSGKIRHDFRGTLTFPWPKTAAQFGIHQGDPGYDPQFPTGYGLRYTAIRPVGLLSERSGVSDAAVNLTDYFSHGRIHAPWRIALADAGGLSRMEAAPAGHSPNDGVKVEAVDADGVQEAGRRLTWSGKGEASFQLTGAPVDLSRQANGAMVLTMTYILDGPLPDVPVRLSLDDKGHGVDIRGALHDGGDQTLEVSLSCLQKAGGDVSHVHTPFQLTTGGAFSIVLTSVYLGADPAGAYCPG